MSAESIPQTYMGLPATPLPVSKRVGEWVLAKHRYGYAIYHAPAGLPAKSIPDSAIFPSFRRGRDWIGYRQGLAVLNEVASAFPSFDRDADTRALKAWLDARQAA